MLAVNMRLKREREHDPGEGPRGAETSVFVVFGVPGQGAKACRQAPVKRLAGEGAAKCYAQRVRSHFQAARMRETSDSIVFCLRGPSLEAAHPPSRPA